MKKIKILSLLLSIIVIGSCSKDADDILEDLIPSDAIVGTWILTENIYQSRITYDYEGAEVAQIGDGKAVNITAKSTFTTDNKITSSGGYDIELTTSYSPNIIDPVTITAGKNLKLVTDATYKISEDDDSKLIITTIVNDQEINQNFTIVTLDSENLVLAYEINTIGLKGTYSYTKE